MDSDSTKTVIALLNALPSGVIAMSKEIEGLVETSLNIGILKTENGKVIYSFALRSGVDSEKEKLAQRLVSLAEEFNAEIELYSDYPAWEYKKDSHLRNIMARVYKELYGKPAVIEAIHAGLECGLFSDRIKDLDAVSFGPNLYDIHSSKERLSVSSVERSYNYLVKVLENL
jgi:dipeptidase D